MLMQQSWVTEVLLPTTHLLETPSIHRSITLSHPRLQVRLAAAMPGPMMQLQAVTQETTALLQSAGDVFKQGNSSSPAPVEQPSLIRNTVDKLRADTAKVGVLVGDATAALEASEITPLLTTLAQTVAGLCAGLHALTYQAGPSLVSELKAGAQHVVKQSTALVQALPAQSQQPLQAAAAVKAAVAQVWDACEAIKKLPMDNKTSLFRQLAAALRVAKDVLREMNELQHQNSSIRENGHEAADNGDEVEEKFLDTQPAAASRDATAADPSTPSPEAADEVQEPDDVSGQAMADLDYDGGPLSAAEQEVVSAAQQLIQLAVTCLQQLAKVLLPADTLPSGAVEGWESTVWHVKTLRRGLEDLGAALYGPQDKEEVNDCCEAITISLECMLDELPEEGPQVQAEQLRELQLQLEMCKSWLTAVVAALPDTE